MPRTLWRRRRTADSPRPAGRRWSGRWRRGGVLARRVLRRRRLDSTLAVDAYQPSHVPHPLRPPEPRGTRPAESRGARPVASTVTVSAPGTVETGRADTGGAEGGAAEDRGADAGPLPLLPGDRTVARQVRFALVNLCTLGSLGLGVLAVLLAMRGEVQLAALCLVACVAVDGLDGVLARRLGVSSPFGAQMDSLADMVAFGVAAPVVVYASLAGAVPRPAAALVCALVAGCAAIRLARFNVSGKDGRFFTGVPTTTVAAVLACAVLIGLPLPPAGQLLGLAVLALAMVSSFPYATLGVVLRLPVWLWLAPIAGVLVDPQLTFVLMVSAYLASGPVLWVHQRRRAA